MKIVDKFLLVNKAETVKELEDAILSFADQEGHILGRTRFFDAKKMADYVYGVVHNLLEPNYLTREFGIRQQALYLRYYEKF